MGILDWVFGRRTPGPSSSARDPQATDSEVTLRATAQRLAEIIEESLDAAQTSHHLATRRVRADAALVKLHELEALVARNPDLAQPFDVPLDLERFRSEVLATQAKLRAQTEVDVTRPEPLRAASHIRTSPPAPAQRKLDQHGQPNAAFNAERRADRAIHEMLGICKVILADGLVTPEEATFLRRWLAANPEATADFAGATIARRLSSIFEDGRIDPDEQRDLAGLLRLLVGGKVSVIGGENVATALPLDRPPPPVLFDGRTFVFTGRLAFGPRHACEEAVIELGGTCRPNITKRSDYVVIGSFGSRDWAHTSYGRKIQKAVDYRESGCPIAIIAEDHWAAALP
jgi:hypothetical protein